MPRRVAITLLAFFVVILGLLGFYSFSLNKEIVALAKLQEETNLQLQALGIAELKRLD